MWDFVPVRSESEERRNPLTVFRIKVFRENEPHLPQISGGAGVVQNAGAGGVEL